MGRKIACAECDRRTKGECDGNSPSRMCSAEMTVFMWWPPGLSSTGLSRHNRYMRGTHTVRSLGYGLRLPYCHFSGEMSFASSYLAPNCGQKGLLMG